MLYIINDFIAVHNCTAYDIIYDDGRKQACFLFPLPKQSDDGRISWLPRATIPSNPGIQYHVGQPPHSYYGIPRDKTSISKWFSAVESVDSGSTVWPLPNPPCIAQPWLGLSPSTHDKSQDRCEGLPKRDHIPSLG